jgi:hypothetical protein
MRGETFEKKNPRSQFISSLGEELHEDSLIKFCFLRKDKVLLLTY